MFAYLVWLCKLTNEDGVWQELIRKKYLKNKTISEVKWKPGDFYFFVKSYEGQRLLPQIYLRLNFIHYYYTNDFARRCPNIN